MNKERGIEKGKVQCNDFIVYTKIVNDTENLFAKKKIPDKQIGNLIVSEQFSQAPF